MIGRTKKMADEASRRLVCCGKRPQKNKTAIFKRYSRFKKGQYNIAALVLAGKLIRKSRCLMPRLIP